ELEVGVAQSAPGRSILHHPRPLPARGRGKVLCFPSVECRTWTGRPGSPPAGEGGRIRRVTSRSAPLRYRSAPRSRGPSRIAAPAPAAGIEPGGTSMTELHPEVAAVTERVVARSRETRRAYLDLIAREREAGVRRGKLACGNLAHGFAA